MAAPTFKKTKVQQKINLKEEFGVDVSDRPDLAEALGQAIIDKMVTRTKASKGMQFSGNGAGREIDLSSKKYSKEYKDSREFKAFGKTNKVNLTLTGDMLGQIDITKLKGNSVTIGWDDPEENGKAHGHSTGKNGKAPKMKRPFFGVNKKELKGLKKEFKSDLNKVLKEEQTKKQKALTSNLLKALGALSDGKN